MHPITPAATANQKLSPVEYQTLVEQASIMIWRADLSMGCDYFNERWLTFTGRTLEQEMGNGWAEGVHAEDLGRCLDTYTRSFAAREIFEMEYRLRRADDTYRWVFDRGVPYSDEVGSFAGYIGSCTDVTERVEGQNALKALHEAELRTLRGLLPICSSCKNIRDDHGNWSKIESYITKHSSATFTHSLCPDCMNRYFPIIAPEKKSPRPE